MSQSPKNSTGLNLEVNLNLTPEDEAAIRKICALALELTGIQLNDRHQSMIASRLRKRLLELNLPTLTLYLEYFHTHRVEESPKMVALLTTHHSYFFREFAHFEFIGNKALPALLPVIRARGDGKLRIWVAACSRGQESYSLAMYLDQQLKILGSDIKFEIFGTDVDAESVGIATNGVYQRNELKEVPLPLLGDHWAKGTGEIEAFVKAKKSLRDHCTFRTANLLELKEGTPPTEKFDLIFCRNVFIYFNADQIKYISQQLIHRLTPSGYFFVGISESLTNLGLPVGVLGPSVYQHKAFHDAELSKLKSPGLQSKDSKATPAAPLAAVPQRLMRILCVDDSPSILTLMKQILTKDNGFEVVGIAKNGLEAAKQVLELKPDAMTLDIHMPEQTGIEYLEKNFRTGHVPVVMVTSVSRDNADLAGKALSLGASDYVEKPALTNLAERGEEIRNKLRCAIHVNKIPQAKATSLDRSFQRSHVAHDIDHSLRLIVLPLSARSKLKSFLKELYGIKQPATLLLIEGAKDSLGALAGVLATETMSKITGGELPSSLKPNDIHAVDFPSSMQKIWDLYGKNTKISILVFGDVSKAGAEKILSFKGAQLVLEDLGSGKGAKELMRGASDVVPFTSFGYLSTEYFAEKSDANTPSSLGKKAG